MHNEEGNMFEAKGDRPQWQVIYEHLSTLQIGDEVTDGELFALLPDAPEASVRTAFWRAVKELEEKNLRTMARVRTKGYRMVEPAEHERLARDQHRKARRRLRAARAKIRSADPSLLTEDQRRRFAAIEDHLARHEEMLKRFAARQEKTEQRIAATEKDHAKLADKVEWLEKLLARHGIRD